MRLNRLLRTLADNQEGASTVEYGMILAFIVLAILAVLRGFAGETVSMWDNVATRSSEAMSKN
jgi:pilus assembly protein Flp/PilA